MRTWLDRLYSISQVAAAACLFLICAAVMVQIIGRALGYLVPSVPEIAGFLLGATIFLSLPATLRANEHIRVTLITERLPDNLIGFAEAYYRIIGAALAGFMAWRMLIMTLESWEFGDQSAGVIGVPYWIPQAAMFFGLATLAIRFIEELVTLASSRSAPRPTSITPESAS